MLKADSLHRYLFEKHDVRGELVTLSDTYCHILENHNYPVAVQRLLGEMLVATSLLTAILKFDGDITVQLQGDGPLKLAVINGNNQQEMRGVARPQGDIADNATLREMLGNGYLVITIMPKDGERYQGVVGLEGDTVSSCSSLLPPVRTAANPPVHQNRRASGTPGGGRYAAAGAACTQEQRQRVRSSGNDDGNHHRRRTVQSAG